jgi:hypothetical protein
VGHEPAGIFERGGPVPEAGGRVAVSVVTSPYVVIERSLAAHKAVGLWRTAGWLMRELADYRFLFRNHCWCGAGAVVYAIPREGRQ